MRVQPAAVPAERPEAVGFHQRLHPVAAAWAAAAQEAGAQEAAAQAAVAQAAAAQVASPSRPSRPRYG
jgi:hypothetical protein